MEKLLDSTCTFLDALVLALEQAASYNKSDQVPPAAVLWTDKDRQWEPLLPRLRERLPLLTLGPYAPRQRTGPAYWLRCMVDRALPDDIIPPDQAPVIYLPGVSRHEMRAVEDCPKALQPLAELQYRGVIWTHKNGRDWTIAAFLQSSHPGLEVQVGADNATREAMRRALQKLASEPVAYLSQEAPLRAAFFDALLNPDEVRRLLLWLNNPTGYRKECTPEEWKSFCSLCKAKYGFHPEQDGEITAARFLGQCKGAWDLAWGRFAESPRSYPNLPDLLRRARPQQLQLFEHGPSWPQDNEAAEVRLRQALAALHNQHPDQVRATMHTLEQDHGPRRSWVWAGLGKSPLAMALQHLSALAKETEHSLSGATTAEIAAAYAECGWRADQAVINALAAAENPDDVSAIKGALIVLYRPWLEGAANALQNAVAAGDPSQTYPRGALSGSKGGTCILFSDGLRFDAARGLAAALESAGFACQVDWGLTALPGVTATAKPAVSPVAGSLTGGAGLEVVVKATGAQLNAELLRKLLTAAGYQVLGPDELGDPVGRAWTELGDIDSFGHEHGWKVAHHVAGEIRDLAQRVGALLDHGWKQITILTDHGWLMLPGGLPKADLPEHLTEIRKGRCARLKPFSDTSEQWLPWHWDSSVRVAFVRGICCYEAGRECEHGGLSPQECVVPLIMASRPALAQPVAIENPIWKGLRCTMTIAGATEGLTVDIRTKPGDPHTSLLAALGSPKPDGTVSVLVQDEDRIGEATQIVVLNPDGTLSAEALTRVGG